MVEGIIKGRVSVSLVTWNSWPIVEECIASLFRQNHQPLEVLLVDNASCDGTPEQVRFHYPQVIVFENARNEGFARGHNHNIYRAIAEYVLVLNPDVILAVDFLEILVRVANAEPKAGAFSGLLMRREGGVVDSAGMGFSRWKRVFDDRRKLVTQTESIFGPSGAAALYRRAMLEDICEGKEYFDEIYFAYYEDVDLAWRAQERGWLSLLVPAARGWHIRKAAQGAGARISQSLIFRNRYWTLLKHEYATDFWVHFPIALIFESLRWIKWLFVNPLVFTQLHVTLSTFPIMWRKRKLLSHRRTVPKFTPNAFPID